MSDLSLTIRAIRKRLGKTMVEFADLIGCKQSTISRYEAAKLIPSRTVLILLLQLAQESEKPAILTALGVDQAGAHGIREGDLISALKTFEDYLEISRQKKAERAARPAPVLALAEFAQAGKQIVLAGAEIDPAVASILRHWIAHQENREARKYFLHVAAYLDVELSVLTARR